MKHRSKTASVLTFLCLLLFFSTARSQDGQFSQITPFSSLGLDSLALSSVVLEGGMVESDLNLGFLGGSDPGYWMNSSTAYRIEEDTLFLVSDTSALGIRTALSLKKDFFDRFDISEYYLIARFRSGLFLPVREFSVAGALLYLKVYPVDALIEGVDFIIPNLTTSLQDLSVGQGTWIAGPIPGVSDQIIQAEISNLPSSLSDPGFVFAEASLARLIQLGYGSMALSFTGAPVFVRVSGSNRTGLIGICIPGEGTETDMITCVRPVSLSSGEDSSLVWMPISSQSFRALLPE